MSVTPAMPARPQYYPYIDGLRALAVLAVVIFHLNAAWMPGGFVGVDIFFVISGFVVSLSIASFKGQGLGQFLAYFYARRIKRIFPALIVCLLVTAWVSALLIPSVWLSVVNQKTGLFAFFGLSNFILAQNGRDYFSPTTEFNPYTHTWSLGVEEQFYVIFPLLFLGWLYGRKGKALSVALFALGIVASLVFAAWQTAHSPTDAYFLTPSRFWELAAGVLLYQLTQQKPVDTHTTNHTLRNVGALISLALIVGSMVLSAAHTFPFPGAVPAVVGVLGLIYCMHRHPQLRALHAVLGHRKLVAIGRISYSLYLWHWPVFVMFRWTVGLDTPLTRLVALVLAFGLAVASYTLIENPIRYAKNLRRLPQMATITLGLMCIGGSWWAAKGITDNSQQISLSALSKAPQDWYPKGPAASDENPGCHAEPEYHNLSDGFVMQFTPRCDSPRPLNPHTLYAIGDSHTLAYEGLFKQYALRTHSTVRVYNNGGCPFVSFQLERENCTQATAAALADINERIQPGDVLFLASLRLARLSDQWASFEEANAHQQMFNATAQAERQQGLTQALDTLKPFAERGVHVVLEGPKPLFRAPPFRCADAFNRNNPICQQGFSVPRSLLERFRAPVLETYATLAEQVPNVVVWDPFPVLCPTQACSAFRDGKPLFLDGDHISGFGNQVVLDSFRQFMHKLLEPSAQQGVKPLPRQANPVNGHE